MIFRLIVISFLRVRLQFSGAVLAQDLLTTCNTITLSYALQDVDHDSVHLYHLSDITALHILGQGAFGQVILVAHKVTGRTFALKCMLIETIEKRSQQQLVLAEKEMMLGLKNPYICCLLTTFRNSHSIYMLMDPMLGGELLHLMRSKEFRSMNNDQIALYVAQVVLALEYLHKHKIVYRDLKPENVLLDEEGFLKITDFGLAKKTNLDTFTCCGTPLFIAPEVYAMSGHRCGADWWSLGCVVFEMFMHKTPFEDPKRKRNKPDDILDRILDYARLYPRTKVKWKDSILGPARRIILLLLHPNKQLRLGCTKGGTQAIKKQKFFKSVPWDKLYTVSFLF